ncbi:MAG: hypothetical protein PVSMB10_18900 [Pseudarthrobacter sp.]
MKRRSVVKYAAVAAALSLGLTACGGSGSSDAGCGIETVTSSSTCSGPSEAAE